MSQVQPDFEIELNRLDGTGQTCDIDCKRLRALQKHIRLHHLPETIEERRPQLQYLALVPGIGGHFLHRTDFSEFVHLFKERPRIQKLIAQGQETPVRNPRKRSCPKLTTDVASLSQRAWWRGCSVRKMGHITDGDMAVEHEVDAAVYQDMEDATHPEDGDTVNTEAEERVDGPKDNLDWLRNLTDDEALEAYEWFGHEYI